VVSFARNEADAQAKAASFLGSHQAHRDAIASLQQCQSCHGGSDAQRVFDAAALTALQPQGPWIGVSVGPADGVLRAQLRLPEGTGVVVTQVVPNGPAHQAGVEQHDVLLSVDGKPVAGGEDLDKILQNAKTDAPLALKVLRRGQTLEKQVTPKRSDAAEWLSTFTVATQPSYRIGIQVSDPDETLKKQLGLENRGVVVTEVLGGKPADAAGVKSGDVLLSVNGEPVAKHEELPQKIQAGGEKPVELELMRGGVTLKITVTPVREQAQSAVSDYFTMIARLQPDDTRELMLVHPQLAEVLTEESKAATQPATAAERMKRITEQMAALQREMAQLQEELAKQPEAKPEK
jgi:membrane-associated protease RseP (regulator of RpoE activity)